MKFRFNKTTIVLLPVFLASASVHGNTLGAYLKNREGLKKYEEKAYYPAYQEFLKALQNDPMNPELQLNMGRMLEANEEFNKAEKAYRGALQILPKDSPIKFEVLFNLAGVQAKQKRIDEALATYQMALDLKPDSIEVKNNIELLWLSGGGEGGEGQDQDKSKQQQQNQKQGDRGDRPDNQPDQQQKNKGRRFDEKDISQQDVKRILDEIKNQEQSIRANEYEKGARDAPKGKDW